MAARLIDLSHTVEHGLITYRGLPAPVICDYLTREASREHYAEGTEFHIGRIEMVANTGTYLDSPFHRYADGEDLSALSLTSLANLEGVLLNCAPLLRGGARALDAEAFRGLDVRGRAVLIHTGWDAHWATESYFEGHPFITARAAEFLREAGATLVGIDSLNIDDIDDGHRPAHTILLGAGIPVVEHLCNLQTLVSDGREFKFFAVPVKVKNFGTFPVRAFALVD
ncbi:MAG TPA: cyclase family protein [Pyrinomonadaceae bacterium]|jgi:kynurenine formamidase